MAVGVAVANAILLVTFAERSRMGGAEGGVMSFARSKAKIYADDDVKVSFGDVAGVVAGRRIDTAVPIANCAYELCGSEMPICPNAYMTRPEQSKPRGVEPPHTYGTPR